ncbi:MAG: oxidoreductase domain protein, partial [uncultured Gemmatimonadaceae bacterium]
EHGVRHPPPARLPRRGLDRPQPDGGDRGRAHGRHRARGRPVRRLRGGGARRGARGRGG